jgi:hypothetical protein
MTICFLNKHEFLDYLKLYLAIFEKTFSNETNRSFFFAEKIT